MEDRRVGILTFHGADNLGAVLQAYAFTKCLKEELGINAEIINYKCEKVERTRYPNKKNSLWKTMLLSCYYRIKRRGFDAFRHEYLKLSIPTYDKENIASCLNDYDVFIVGSDQIWNLDCSGYDYTYFLDFVSDKKNKISYAASIGAYEFSSLEIGEIVGYLADFSYLSVREESAVNILKACKKEIAIMPDPVFLLSNMEWKKLVKKNILSQKYVLVYLIQEDVNVLSAARAYASENNCKIVINKKSIEFMLRNSPVDFLTWIYYADAVFTNSFHGTAFAIIFEKNLAADIELKSGSVNNRVSEVLNAANLTKCVISKESREPRKASSNDWLNGAKQTAVKYLIDSISNRDMDN